MNIFPMKKNKKVINLVPKPEDFIDVVAEAIEECGKDAKIIMIVKKSDGNFGLVSNCFDGDYNSEVLAVLEYAKFVVMTSILGDSEVVKR